VLGFFALHAALWFVRGRSDREGGHHE